MPNSISVKPTAITERQRLSAHQLTSLNKNVNLPDSDSSLDTDANSPAYILDLSDPAINQAANHLQASLSQDSAFDLDNSPAYIVDISNESMRLAKQQQEQEDSKTPNILKSMM